MRKKAFAVAFAFFVIGFLGLVIFLALKGL